MPRSVKRGFWREVFTRHATREITRKGARILTALAVLPLLPVCYLVGWLYLPYGICKRGSRRHRAEKQREWLGCASVEDGGPTDADIEAGCDCQQPHGDGVRHVSEACPLHG